LPWAALSAAVFVITIVVSARKGTLGPTVGLLYEARSLGATCVERDASTIWQSLSCRNTVHIVLESDNDVSDVTRASALRRQIMTYGRFDKTPPLRIYSVTSLYGAEALPGVGEVMAGSGRSIENVGVGLSDADSGDRDAGGTRCTRARIGTCWWSDADERARSSCVSRFRTARSVPATAMRP
jgi:hypothetical protein